MTDNSEIPRPIMIGVLDDVYRVAEGLYLATGGQIPNGCKFARSIDGMAEYCFNIATVVYQNQLSNQGLANPLPANG